MSKLRFPSYREYKIQRGFRMLATAVELLFDGIRKAVEKHVIDYDIGFTAIQAHYECWQRAVEKIKEK